MKRLDRRAKIRQQILLRRRERRRLRRLALRRGRYGTLHLHKASPRHSRAYPVTTVVVPEVFSFLDNPEKTIEFLEQMKGALSNYAVRDICIDHSRCSTLGLGASAVMDVSIIREKARRPSSKRFGIHGLFSQRNETVNLMLRGTGILKHLGLKESILPPAIEQHLRRCDLHSGRANRADTSKKRDQAGTDLTTYFNDCLESTGYCLNEDANLYLSSLLTEVIGNAEEHSGSSWYTIGFWQPHFASDGSAKGAGECHLVIFNFGRTIFESLTSDSSSDELKGDLRRLSSEHERNGWFRHLHHRWDEETLWTLYALQDGVSRFYRTPRGRDRGNGTIKMIEFFDHLAGTHKKRMCIVSGKAYILFDGTYGLQDVRKGTEEFKVIAFNAENDLRKPPDSAFVRSLGRKFPGTVVSIRLTIEKDFLNRVVEQL